MTSFWFRRVRTRGRNPFRATEKAFEPVLTRPNDGLTKRVRRKLSFLTAPSTLRGIEWRCVVQVTRIERVAFPQDEQRSENVTYEWLSDQFEIALTKLNELLVAAAAVSRDPAIGPIAPPELPPAVPFIASRIGENDPGLRSLLLLHPGPQGKADDLSDDEVQHIFNITARQHGPGHPFFPMGEAMTEARRALARGRSAQAVLELGIAFELLVATLVRELGPRRGYDVQKIEGVLDAGLKNILQDHVPKLVQVDVDLGDATTEFGEWWMHAYLLRNRIVHRGYRPSVSEAEQARAAVHGVIELVATQLGGDSEQDLAALLASYPSTPSGSPFAA